MEDDIKEPFLNYKEDEDDNDIENEIAQKIRNGFIVKVYGILLYQLAITSLIIFFGLTFPSFKKLLLESYFLYFLSIILSIICLLLPICSPNIFQKVPSNYIVLTVFTLSYSWYVASITCIYSFESVMVALFLTFVTLISLTIYAIKTKEDFSIRGGNFFAFLNLLIFSLIVYIFLRIPFLLLLIQSLSLILLSSYIIYDTQLIVGNKDRKFKEDDYILATMTIYLDVILLFLQLLSCFGNTKSN